MDNEGTPTIPYLMDTLGVCDVRVRREGGKWVVGLSDFAGSYVTETGPVRSATLRRAVSTFRNVRAAKRRATEQGR